MPASRRKRAYEQNAEQPPVGPDDIAELMKRYSYLVHIWARRYAGTSTSVVGWEDLVSVGTMGLIQAHRRYDAAAGRPFEVYAEFRIKGAIIDELRRVDPFSQPHRRKVKQLGAAILELTKELGREPLEAELALHLKLSPTQIRELKEQSQTLKFSPVEEIDRHSLSYDIAVAGWQRADIEIALSRAINELDKRSQTIISLYYMEGLTMAEIADILELTEARISQLHTAAIKVLRESLGNNKSQAATSSTPSPRA